MRAPCMLGLRPPSFRALIPLRDVQRCVCGLDVSPKARRDRHASRSVPMGLPTMPKPASWCRRYCLVGRDEVMRARTCDVRFAWWPQPVDATLYLRGKRWSVAMDREFRRGFTTAEKTELWDRWQRGESLKAIGRE